MSFHRKHLLRATACAAALALAGPASALDFNGYFRVGPGSTAKNQSRACYGLAGAGLKYRLGNECDIYGEFQFSQGMSKDGVDYRATIMPSIYNPGTDTGSATVAMAQMFAEAKGLDVAPEATFWAGKRFYGRSDVHILDTFFVKMDGVGGGVEGLPVGPGKLGLAYFRDDGTANKAGNRFNLDYRDIPVNPGGKLRLVGTATSSSFTGGASGLGLTLQHNQADFPFIGASNTVWLSTARGSAGLDSNFGNLAANSADKGVRLTESFNWQKGPFGGQAVAMWQQDRLATGGKTNSTSLGGRLSYAVTKNFKMVSELGRSTREPAGAAKQTLTKFTIAPTLSTGSGFWDRPELRFYVTRAHWNTAAGAAANGLPTGRTSQTSVGIQAEMWF